MIHGYCGCTIDENMILGGYFHYAHSRTARQLSDGTFLNSLYEADVSPSGSAHDRACELFQQLVGINTVKAIAEELKI